MKNIIQLQNILNSSTAGKTDFTAGLFKQGQKVSFQVVNALPTDRYVILLNQQQQQIHSRLPLEVGNSYTAEVSTKNGVISLICRPFTKGLIKSLLAQRPSLQGPFSSVLQKLSVAFPGMPKIFSECRTADAVRSALFNCGMFYEAKMHESFRKGKSLSFPNDFKYFLLKQMSQQGPSKLKEMAENALKSLEVRQLLDLQAGLDGPGFFWLPFMEGTFIEGFLKRFNEASESQYILTLRLPLVESEELIITVLWKPGRLEIHFAAGPLTDPVLRKAVPSLKERFQTLGFAKTIIKIARNVPGHLEKELQGIRFFESYG